MKPALTVHEFAADFDVVGLCRLRAKIRANPAIYRDATVRNQLIAMPPRTDAGGSEKSVQAHMENCSRPALSGRMRNGDRAPLLQHFAYASGFVFGRPMTFVPSLN